MGGQMTAPNQVTVHSSFPDAGAVLDAILGSGEWMIRRRDFVEFESEQDLARSHSFDFKIPLQLISKDTAGDLSAVIPLGFWWKAPERYSDIDFEDEAGESLGLPTSTYNARLTLYVMLEYARRLLIKNSVNDIPIPIMLSIAAIVMGDPPLALSDVRQKWRENPDTEIGALANDPEFMALLEVCSLASIVSVQLHDELNRRRVIKMRYVEHQSTYFRTDRYRTEVSTRIRIWRWFGRPARRFLGLGAYKLDLANAFVRSQSYHFEAKAPRGMRFTEVSMKRLGKPTGVSSDDVTDHIHFHVPDVIRETAMMIRSRVIVTDSWMMSAIICAGLTAMVLVGVIGNIKHLDPTTSQNVIAVILLVPSVAISIVWRRVHRLVERLHQGLRYLFLSIAVLLFYLAFRIAESPVSAERSVIDGKTVVTSHFSNAQELTDISWVILAWTALVVVLLIVARFNRARLREIKRRFW
jgi:hypothetical protein